MRKLTIFTLFLLCICTTNAQEKSKRFYSWNEIGVLYGNSQNVNSKPIAVHTSFNYFILPQLSAGLGAGIEIYKEAYLPLLANVTYHFWQNEKVQPFITLQGGYQLPIEKTSLGYYDVVSNRNLWYGDYRYYPQTAETMKAKGGFLLNPAVGFTFKTTSRFGMGVSVGYRYQVLNYYGNENYSLENTYNRISIKLGFIFY